MASSTYRNFIKMLPVVRQTTTLQKFFNATIDQVFQPGELQSLNAYIGLYPSYYNATTDFYKPEITAERSFYQLDPAMVSLDSNNDPQDLLFYPDLINNLAFQGALTNNNARMMQTDYYSWCPQVNLDKLNNYRNYYWMPYGPPVMTITVPSTTYTTDGTTTEFAAPATLTGSIIDVKVQIENEYVTNFTTTTDSSGDITVVFATAPAAGQALQIWTNGNFIQNINGQTSYQYPGSVTCYATNTHLVDEWNTDDNYEVQTEALEYPAITLDPAPALLYGMIVEIIDDTWYQPWDDSPYDELQWDGNTAYEVEFIPQNGQMVLNLVPYDDTGYNSQDPVYWTIERDSDSANPWSLNNRWYHGDLNIYQDNNGFSPIQALRPIVEIFNNTKLFNYGVTRLDPVNVVFNNQPVNVSTLTAGTSILVIADSNNVVSPGIYSVEYNAGANVLVQSGTNTLYDIVKVINGNEYWYNGTAWIEAQPFVAANPPLFDLFDMNGVSLADPSTYPDSTFAGCEIFSYAQDTTGATPVDSILNIPPLFNTYGSFEFNNNIVTDFATGAPLNFFANVTSNSGVVSFDYECHWRYAGVTSQPTDATTGFYEIPQNLQANPDNDEITQISINDWFPQFETIIGQNDWLYPSQYYTLNGGTDIVQNRDNLLKTMLMSSNGNIDMMKTFLYVEREYSRYRAKLVQYLTTMLNTGQIQTVSQALGAALSYLAVTKTSQFSFYNNGMGGGNYYIPASGAYLGLTPLWVPEMIIQNTLAGGSVLMIRGHDGSLIAGFSKFDSQNVTLTNSSTVSVDGTATTIDIRDQILLAYEQQLYSSCSTILQNQRRPLFDVKSVTPGKFRTTDYSVTEFNQVAMPLFERWAARGQKDYTTNTIFNGDDVWTWNFSTYLDADGQPVPGYWRGIYRYFYDTDRPDTAPWEMLGYTSEPSWWGSYYSWTNPTQRAALIAAIVAGNVAEPTGTQIDPVFARPTFEKYIPVDDNGNLLDPFEAGILFNTGSHDIDADWVFGDCGPVENSWWNSEYGSFILSELGYLLRPIRFVDTGWEAIDNILVFPGEANQWISNQFGRRKHFADFTVHNELINGTPYRDIGLQQWVSDYVTSNGQNVTTNFGDHVRGLIVKLANKVGGFTDSSTLEGSLESSGQIPSENITVEMYDSPCVNEFFYSGVIVKWNGSGWAVMGYDTLNPAFTIIPVNTAGSNVTISLGPVAQSVRPWLPNTFYQTGVQVVWQNATYVCTSTHTSGTTFEQQFWDLVSSSVAGGYPSLKFYTSANPGTQSTTVAYGTVFYTLQDVSNFLASYQLYLTQCGWVFNGVDSSTGLPNDFRLSVNQILNWAQVSWAPDTFITVSPLSSGVKFETEFGAIQSLEQNINGFYSILDRGGSPIASANTLVNRINGAVTVTTVDGTGIYGVRLCVNAIEHALIFDNTTIFNDVIYEPLYNLRQSRIRMNYNISTNWTGTLNAPGFVLTDNIMMPSFETTVSDVRYMYDIEKPVYSVMRDYARHQIGYQAQSYLNDIFTNELNQFEFYQGMIQQKGTVDSLDKLLRNTTLTQTTDLQFLEEFAFRIGDFGAVNQTVTIQFEITTDDIKQEPMEIDFLSGPEGLTAAQLTALQNPDSSSLDLYSNSTAYDTRWIYTPPSNNVFPTVQDYIRYRSDLPTAGYVRTDEALVGAPTTDILNPMVQASTVSIDIADRVWLYTNTFGTFDVLRADTGISSSDPAYQGLTVPVINAVTGEQTGTTVELLDNSVAAVEWPTITLLYLPSMAVGDYVSISTPTGTTPDFGGVYQVTAINGYDVTLNNTSSSIPTYTYDSYSNYTNAVDTSATIPVANGQAPTVRRMISVRYSDYKSMNTQGLIAQTTVQASTLTSQLGAGYITPSTGWNDGELIYIDCGYEFAYQAPNDAYYTQYQKRWTVYEWNAEQSQFVLYRSQSPRINRSLISSAQIFDTVTQISTVDNTMEANPLLLPSILIYDPIQGLIPGSAKEDITFMQSNDPANYNVDMSWLDEHVGRLWWDISQTSFLLAETNDLTNLDSTDSQTEITYRIKNWGQVAPNSTVSIYEWTQSTVTPQDWMDTYNSAPTETISGPVLNPDNPVWTTETVSGTTYYYFWVLNPILTPSVSFRTKSAETIASLITDPANNGIAWMSPVSSNTVVAHSISQYLTPTSSMQIRVKKTDAQVGKHSEWTLIRPGDPLSQPTDRMFTDMVDSLAGKNSMNQPIPNPDLYSTIQTGPNLKMGQSWISNLTTARSILVEYLNEFFGAMNLADERPYALPVLEVSQAPNQYLQWAQTQGSLYLEPIPPSNLWNKRFRTLREFQNAYEKDPSVSPALVMDFSVDTPFWSVLEIDDGVVNFTKLWDVTVSSLSAMQALAGTVADGYRVLVTANSQTANFWTVWQWSESANQFNLLTTQQYNTNDIFTLIDWYATGYTSTMQPTTIFAKAVDRTIALGANPQIQYTMLLDDGTGSWAWQVWQNNQWVTVAKQNGTIQFNANVYENTGNTFDVTGTLPSNFASLVSNRDMGTELNIVLNAFQNSVLEPIEMNELFFMLINYLFTEQDYIDWIFKTSFMYIQGYDATLIASPIAEVDYTPDVESYINSVKPYHVKIRSFTATYAANDTADVHVTDFDKPVYYDASLGKYRILEVTNPQDLNVLSTNANYVDWYNQWQAGDSLVRSMKITVVFDRVSLYSNLDFGYEKFDTNLFETSCNGAIDRIITLAPQVPVNTIEEKAALFNGAVFQNVVQGNAGSANFAPVYGMDFTNREVDIQALNFADSGNGKLMATNTPSFVVFAEKFMPPHYPLPVAWNAPQTDNPGFVWGTMNSTWDQYNNYDWKDMTNQNTAQTVYQSFEFTFTDPTGNFGTDTGPLLEVYVRERRLSLGAGDYIVTPNGTVANSWNVYFKETDLNTDNYVVIMLVEPQAAPSEIINGGTLIPEAYQDIILGGKFWDPRHQANHPEELVQVLVAGGVRFRIYQNWTVGGMTIENFQAPQDTTATQANGGVLTYAPLPYTPQSKMGVAVFGNGLRIPQSEYTYDAEGGTISYSGGYNLDRLDMTIFGYGGINQITSLDNYNGDGSTTSFLASSTIGSPADVFVTVSGEPTSAFTVSNNEVVFNTAPASGALITIIAMPSVDASSVYQYMGNGSLNVFEFADTVSTASDLMVMVAGNMVQTEAMAAQTNSSMYFTLNSSGNAISFSITPGFGQNVVIIVNDGSSNVASTSMFEEVDVQEVQLTTLSANTTFAQAFGLSSIPSITQSIIEIDGKRVMPSGVYDLDVVPGNDIVTMAANVQYANLTATLEGQPIVIGDNLRLNTAIPTTGSVYLGGYWGSDALTVLYNGSPLIVGDIVAFAPGFVPNVQNPQLQGTDSNGNALYVVQPSNAQLVVYQGYLMDINNTLTSPMNVEVYFENYVPEDMTGFVYDSPNNAPAQAILNGVQLRVISGSGHLIVYDAGQIQLNYGDSLLSQFPTSNLISLTTFTNVSPDAIRTVTYNDNLENWFLVPGWYKSKPTLWVTQNGTRLTEGVDFYVEPGNMGWNIMQWGEDNFDQYPTIMEPDGWDMEVNGFDSGSYDMYFTAGVDLLSYAIRMNIENGATLNQTDMIVITSFGDSTGMAQPAYEEIIYLNPLREYGLPDIDHVVQAQDYYILESSLDQYETDIVLTQSTAHQGAWPSFTGASQDNPGVMMLGTELIKYIDISVDSTTGNITLVNTQRGYLGTSQVTHDADSQVINLS
jgi:hypothetical protein